MSTVTLDTKRHAIILLIGALIEERVKNLHQRQSEHHKTILGEVFDGESITKINTMSEIVVAFPELTQQAIDKVSGWWRMGAIKDGEVVRNPFASVDYRESAPFWNLSTGDGFITQQLDAFFDEVWNACAKSNPTRITLPVPMFVIVDKPSEDSTGCNVDDESEETSDYFSVNVSDFIPSEDCTTAREFSKMAKAIGEDASNLAKQIFNTIRPCRSESAILALVPDLEPYICSESASPEGRKDSISSLIKKVRS